MDTASVDEGEIWASRSNVDGARFQAKLLSSLPPRLDTYDDHQDENTDDEQDDRTMSETGGVGSKIAKDEAALLDGILNYRPQFSNDKLLEHLIGTKAARERKISRQQQPQAAGKGVLPSKQSSVRQHASTRQVESEDEDEGRASAFSSRRPQKRAAKTTADDTPPNSTKAAKEEDAASADDAVKEPASPPSKKRAGNSYLDELLAQKSKKKKKKSKKGREVS